MNLAFACPECDQTTRVDITSATRSLACAHCRHEISVPAEALPEQKVERCLCCGSRELYVRKDFSQQVGVGIIVVGSVASSIAWWYYWRVASYGILFATALLDLVLYFTVGNLLECYRCHAQYRGLPELETYGPFRLEVHEKYRQQAIRTREAEASSKYVPPRT